MRSYSPCDNLEQQALPGDSPLVTTSLNDLAKVMYWERRWQRYVSQAEGSEEDRSAPAALLQMQQLGAGHGGSSGRYDRLKETAFEYRLADGASPGSTSRIPDSRSSPFRPRETALLGLWKWMARMSHLAKIFRKILFFPLTRDVDCDRGDRSPWWCSKAFSRSKDRRTVRISAAECVQGLLRRDGHRFGVFDLRRLRPNLRATTDRGTINETRAA